MLLLLDLNSTEERANRPGSSLPFATLTLSTSSTTGSRSGISSSARAVKGVPALRAGNAHNARTPVNRGTRVLTASTGSSTRKQLQARQQQRSKRLGPWKLPLAVAALAFHVARSAARVSARQLLC